MFDFGAGELAVIGVVALVVIGPKELPGLLRTVGQAVGKMRRMASDFQGQFQEALREAELQDVQKVVQDIKSDVSASLDPVIPSITQSIDAPRAGSMTPAPPPMMAPPTPFELPESEVIAEAEAPAPFELTEDEPAPAPKKRTRKAKSIELEAGSAETTADNAPASDEPDAAPETAKPARKRTKKAAPAGEQEDA